MDEATGARAATIEFQHVSKHYDAATMKSGEPGAVDDLSLTVPAGPLRVEIETDGGRARYLRDGCEGPPPPLPPGMEASLLK